jgi:hypothetical protein
VKPSKRVREVRISWEQAVIYQQPARVNQLVYVICGCILPECVEDVVFVPVSSWFSATIHSVLKSRPATDAAFCSALRTGGGYIGRRAGDHHHRDSGSGNTHLLIGLAVAACRQKRRVRFDTARCADQRTSRG